METKIGDVNENGDELSQFDYGHICWAKMKGSPWWPARIDFIRSSECPIKKQGPDLLAKPGFWHPVFFYGDHSISWIKYENLRAFDAEEALEESKDYSGKRVYAKLKAAITEAVTTPWVKLQFKVKRLDRLKALGPNASSAEIERILIKRLVAGRQRWIAGKTERVDEENKDWRALKRSSIKLTVELDPDGRARA